MGPAGNKGKEASIWQFILPGAPIKNIISSPWPLVIHLPDSKTLKSTTTQHLDLSCLPEASTQAHVVPALAHTSLVSTKMLCDVGCKVSYDKEKLLIL